MPETIPTKSISLEKSSFEKGIAKKGIWIKTYGCQMNEYDSEKVLA